MRITESHLETRIKRLEYAIKKEKLLAIRPIIRMAFGSLAYLSSALLPFITLSVCLDNNPYGLEDNDKRAMWILGTAAIHLGYVYSPYYPKPIDFFRKYIKKATDEFKSCHNKIVTYSARLEFFKNLR